MQIDEPITTKTEPIKNQTLAKDKLIRLRESLLNKFAGVHPALVINNGPQEPDQTVPTDLAAKLKSTLDVLLLSAMNETGTMIDYAALRESPAYARYQKEDLALLRHFQPAELTTLPARRAFWINLYNVLVMDAVINLGIRSSVTEGPLGLLFFFRRAAYVIDGLRVSLEDMEQGILRGNRGNPYIPGAHFPAGNPRLKWVLPLDPRHHFALNCGGRSCPPIRSYTAEKLNDQLDLATHSFLSATTTINPEKKEIHLSPIFKWYKSDFGGSQGMLDFLIRYLPDDERRRTLLHESDPLRLQYTPYDWRLNEN